MLLGRDEPSGSALPFRASIVTKIGVMFGLLALVYSVALFISARMTHELNGLTAAMDEAGSLRMRVYKIGVLISAAPPTEKGRQLIRNERDRWFDSFQLLRAGSDAHGPIGNLVPALDTRLEHVSDAWSNRLAPSIEQVLQPETDELRLTDIQQQYLREADELVSSLSGIVGTLQQHAAARFQRLYGIQIFILGLSVVIMSIALLVLYQQIRIPLGRLAGLTGRLLVGPDPLDRPPGRRDELTTLTQSIEQLMERFIHNRDEIQALHATGQEISSLGTLTLDEILKRIVDRAADLVRADQAALLLRHPFMECWVVEATSGGSLDRIEKKILLFEQTPLIHKVYESRKPTSIDDLSSHARQPEQINYDFGAKSFLGVPLLTPHGCIGVLALMSTGSLCHFGESDVHLAQQFASYAAVTIENARLFESVESESKQLKDKLAAVERKVAELTHEVKAPAGRVAEFAGWIEKDYGSRLDEKGLRYLHWIQKEGRDLSSLADRTLNWSRLTQVPASVESVDMQAVVHEVLELLEQDRARKGVEIHVASDLPRLVCQRIHVKQILENLIANAIKYMGTQPRPRIDIGWGEREGVPYFFVRDNGKGIEPSMQHLIFLPFQRLATEEPGAGIGLSIVKTVLDHYGEKVWVESQPGEGSTFWFTLPTLNDEQPNRSRPTSQEPFPDRLTTERTSPAVGS